MLGDLTGCRRGVDRILPATSGMNHSVSAVEAHAIGGLAFPGGERPRNAFTSRMDNLWITCNYWFGGCLIAVPGWMARLPAHGCCWRSARGASMSSACRQRLLSARTCSAPWLGGTAYVRATSHGCIVRPVGPPGLAAVGILLDAPQVVLLGAIAIALPIGSLYLMVTKPTFG